MKLSMLFVIAAGFLVMGGPAIASELTAGLKRIETPAQFVPAMTQDYTPRVRGGGIDAVQEAVNRNRYIEDGQADAWNPAALWEKGGDCDDFALAKIRELQAQGFEGLGFAVAKGKRTGRHHAVAIVKDGGEWFVLDNQHTNKWPLHKFLDVWAIEYVTDADTRTTYTMPD